jgi:photosystem II Psb27 protein
MRTALNAIAGHYSAYPNRPLPEKLKTRVEQELKQVESALNRGA